MAAVRGVGAVACHQQGRPHGDGLLDTASLNMKHVDDEDDNLHRSPSPSSLEATLSIPRVFAQASLPPIFNVPSPINSSTDLVRGPLPPV